MFEIQTSAFAADFAPYAAQGLTPARVCLSIHDEYRLLTAAGEVHAQPCGALLYSAACQADLPAVGDWVAARLVAQDEAIVYAVLPRRSKFSRRAAGAREEEQIIAANVDTVFVVSGLDHDFNLRRIERYLTLAHESGACPVLVLNKADLCPAEVPLRVREVNGIAAGVPVVAVSAQSGDVAALLPFVRPGKTVALLGSSGAGKSTLVNCLAGAGRQKTAEVRPADSRGRHTTTHRELILLPSGAALIDNPGMRELQLWAGESSLEQAFSEIGALASQCRFSDCVHEGEPGCAVREALDSGALDRQRWESYVKLRAEIRFHEIKTSRSAAAAEKQRWKTIHKAQRAYKKHW